MDHVGAVARRESARLIIQRMKELTGGKHTILTGDFNANQTDESYKMFSESGFLHDCYVNAHQRMAPAGTWNDYMQDCPGMARIDHIFVTKDFDINHYGIFTNSYWLGKTRRNISDHYPVMVKLQMN